jgi:acyl carrier protein
MGLDIVELVIRVKKEFDIEIPNADASRLVTVGSLHGYIVEALRRQGRIESSDSVYAQLRDIICCQLGVKPEDVVPAARFVDDLGAD